MIPKTKSIWCILTTGTHVAQICWFLLTEARYLPASLLQTSPAPKGAADDAVAAGIYSVIDLDLSRYAALTSRFQREQQQSISFLKAGIETRNATFNALIDRIERVAIRSTDPILLTGPTGAGKSVPRQTYFSASSVAPSGGGKIHGGKLRHAAR
ncbi:transcriptional regulatory protein RtcR [Klebsiella michiganensis]|uniref:Transcriptional regulatory protein RtcR n=1 Tax=Klebsiella michiganensis TaxID=1134687 RepID=A0A7H4PDL3_9ENTR|nr:transcriptional regulatory protein RtcR [Klebsiella michiganensis]